MKIIFITEKPSVAQEYRKALKVNSTEKHDGYIEGFSPVMNTTLVITWCVGHLCELSYPEVYDPALKKWDMAQLPFLPQEYKYNVKDSVKKQFDIVKRLYHVSDLDAIYYAGDAGREGLYIQMLVRQMAGTKAGIKEKIIWIDSYTEREILKGIREAKDVSEYKSRTAAAYMRAIEDYAMGINFSRALSCKFGKDFNARIASDKWVTIAVGRVMSCVLGMVVSREREIKNFTETPFYKVEADTGFKTEWKAVEGSAYENSPLLYNESGFREREKAEYLVNTLAKTPQLKIKSLTVTDEKKSAPLLFNLAEIQNECTKKYKISPDETLAVIQSLYEKKLVTYPRTDARVLSSAVAAEVHINLNGLAKLGYKKDKVVQIAQNQWHKKLINSRYCDDSKITDHYAIIPTGYIDGVDRLSELELNIYHDIIDRFLCVFFPPAVFTKAEVVMEHSMFEKFFGSHKTIKEYGYLDVLDEKPTMEENTIAKLKEGAEYNATFAIKEGKTTAPKRYTSGSMVLAMENAGNLIEDEELRALIKGNGIGTSATRAEIIKKLVSISYLALNKKTQILTPTVVGECVYDILLANMPQLLNPEMTASWEKGLVGIEEGRINAKDYQTKMESFITTEVEKIKSSADVTYSVPQQEKIECICPICKKGKVFEGKKAFGCSEYKNGCNFTIWKTIAGKNISKSVVEKLVTTGKTSVLKGFKNKEGKTFDAALQFQDGKVTFLFNNKKK